MSRQKRMPNIYIVGAQCTGKTTLVNELAIQFGALSRTLGIDEPQIISEVARTVLNRHHFVADDISSSPSRSLALQALIVAAQADAETNALSRRTWFISDRSCLDPVVYARRYVGFVPAREMEHAANWLELRERMVGSLIIVCEAGSEWLNDDGVRLMPEGREDWLSFHRMFCTLLDETGLPYWVLPCKMDRLSQRAQFVLSKWSDAANITLGLV